MIADKMLWPVLHRRFQARGTPDWFQKRVCTRIQALSAGDRIPAERIWALVFLGLLLLLLLLKILSTAFAQEPLYVVLVPAGWLLSSLFPELQKGRRLWTTGRAIYDQVVQDARAELTGHERLEYEACIQTGQRR